MSSPLHLADVLFPDEPARALRVAPDASPARAGCSLRIVARRRRSLVFLSLEEVWAVEAAGRLTFVHSVHGKFDLDLSLAAVTVALGQNLGRVHRNWLVNWAHVKEMQREGAETKIFVGPGLAGSAGGMFVPVARERASGVRDMLLSNAVGLRIAPAHDLQA